MALKLMYITNNPQVALIAEKYGVDRVWIDLETVGKEERQKNVDGVKSHHTIEDVKVMSKALQKADLMVRINPWGEYSKEEIEKVIEAGAKIVMLPMWKTLKEAQSFINAVNGRCKTVLLLETKEGAEILDEVLENALPDEIHIGLNDLHLSYGLNFMFELLANGTVESLCNKIKSKNIPYGFGGIARLGAGELKAEMVIKEHYRLGSTRAILSRSFCDVEKANGLEEIEQTFSKGLKELKDFENQLKEYKEEDFLLNKKEVEKITLQIAEIKKAKKSFL